MSYVYVITDDMVDCVEDIQNVKVVKIGFTSDDNIQNRIRQLQTGNPRPLNLIDLYEFQNTDMARQMERACHWNLCSEGLTGEWFQFSQKVKNILSCIAYLSNHYPYPRLEEYFANKGVKNG